jgi:TPR repeat protein
MSNVRRHENLASDVNASTNSAVQMSTESDKDWKQKLSVLESDGDLTSAAALLRSIAEVGNDLEARLSLAKALWKMNRYAEAHTEIELVERGVSPSDGELSWKLHLAYALGVGEYESQERSKRAFHHLCQSAALMSYPRPRLSVAVHFRDGLNGVDKDLAEAERWFQMAAATGDLGANEMLDRFIKEKPALAKRASRSWTSLRGENDA